MDDMRRDGEPAERVERLVRNEGVMRDVNEQIEALNDWGAQLTRFGVVCECGSTSCSDTIEVDREAYEEVRAHGARFIVTPGHDVPEVERVVARYATYEIVEKRPGVAQGLAEANDPRR